MAPLRKSNSMYATRNSATYTERAFFERPTGSEQLVSPLASCCAPYASELFASVLQVVLIMVLRKVFLVPLLHVCTAPLNRCHPIREEQNYRMTRRLCIWQFLHLAGDL
ncbi:hypothetical protein TRVL_08842 [Trypanosoma vivax]|nr:hypothetical protein TRVL_08842 [Trypanosoma vivax]